jgi:two-component system OmpR family sensor kinase
MQKMLTLARLEQPRESDGPEAALQSCSLLNAIEDAIHQSKPLAELKTIKIKFESTADAKVQIDSRDALLLCSNILLNALQHSPEGTRVLVAMALGENNVRFIVQDQGEGISAEDRAHVFEPFYRGDPSRSRKSGGTGLGLSICKAICERAGGSIEIANNPTGGAVVTMMLPAEPMTSSPTISASFKAQ